MSPAFARVTKQFTHAAGDAVSDVSFFGERRMHSFNRAARSVFGIMPNWAIDKDNLIKRLEQLLPHGHTTPLNAVALLSAASVRHKDSRYDTVAFFNNFLCLYNADSFEQACKIEKVEQDSTDWFELSRLNESKGLDAVKIRLWAKDLEIGTRGKPENLLGKVFGRHKRIRMAEIESLIALYRPPANDNLSKDEDPSAFKREDYLPLLRKMRHEHRMSETQTGLILCFILHAKETRNDGTSYITHPMAVANVVRKIAHALGLNNEEVWQATIAALLHDGGEKTTLKIMEDLKGLLPQKIIDAVDALHKRDGETYFEYLERCCTNKLAAVVKLADLWHNSTDMGKNPSSKQAFIYPLSAAYVRYKIAHPDEKISVHDFATEHLNISPAHFDELNGITESKDVKDAQGNTIEKAAKKKSATEFPHLQKALNGLKSVGDIIKGITQPNAYARREEALALHL